MLDEHGELYCVLQAAAPERAPHVPRDVSLALNTDAVQQLQQRARAAAAAACRRRPAKFGAQRLNVAGGQLVEELGANDFEKLCAVQATARGAVGRRLRFYRLVSAELDRVG